MSQIKWSGEGLPPVGAVVEYAMHDGGDWEEVEVIAHHNGYAVLAITSTDGFNVDVAEHNELRPACPVKNMAADRQDDSGVRPAVSEDGAYRFNPLTGHHE